MKRDQKEIEFLLRTTLCDVTKSRKSTFYPWYNSWSYVWNFCQATATSARYYDDKVACSARITEKRIMRIQLCSEGHAYSIALIITMGRNAQKRKVD